MKPVGRVVLVIIFCFTSLVIFTAIKQFKSNEKQDLYKKEYPDLEEFVTSYGYNITSHLTKSQDGYVLKMFRVSKPSVLNSSYYPVLLLHGLSSCANGWFLNNENSLPYVLADQGYDVWLSNSRGTLYSNRHTRFTAKSRRFWQFSWHEIGIYDVPAFIDKVLNETNKNKLALSGHSEGTTQFLVMASELPEYQKKITFAYLMAPIAYFKNNVFSSVCNFVGVGYMSNFLAETFKSWSMAPESSRTILPYLCKTFKITCKIVPLIFGDLYDVEQNTLQYMLSKVPCGGSVKELLHYGKIVDNGGDFAQYDYGEAKNIQVYNATRPPTYKLENIQNKVIINYSENGDFLSSPLDVKLLATRLKNSVLYKANASYYSHMGYLMSNKAVNLTYNKFVYYLGKHNKILNV